MMKYNTCKLKAYLIMAGSALLLISPPATAHSGHSHTQLDNLTGILHALTTHPMLFSALGLVFVMAILNAHR